MSMSASLCRRKDFAHQHSRRIVDGNQVIAVEDLSINAMVHNHCLAKSMSDAAWGQFTEYLTYKAANAGRQFVKINPAYTSQDRAAGVTTGRSSRCLIGCFGVPAALWRWTAIIMPP